MEISTLMLSSRKFNYLLTKQFFIVLLVVILTGCQTGPSDFYIVKEEKNIVEERLNRIIIEREELGFMGQVRSSLEFEFDSMDWTDQLIKLNESKYSSISADDQIKEIYDVPIRESNSYLFNKSGRLIKDIRFVEDDDVYMADVEQYIFDEKDKLLEWNSSGFGGGLNVQRLFMRIKS
jgi:uncharacterized Zn ribbon protein